MLAADTEFVRTCICAESLGFDVRCDAAVGIPSHACDDVL